jgi:hypothetical protein
MTRESASPLALLTVNRERTMVEDRALADACQRTLREYRRAIAAGKAPRQLANDARRAFLHLGGDPAHSTASLKDYDHLRYGPFLGVSDEGSAACAIRDAAFGSPKVRALPRSRRMTPLVVGVALDAERLGGVGETIVGPDEYADVWLQCVDRILLTTNVGTRANLRVYRREPVVLLKSASPEAIRSAKGAIAAAFQPFVNTPDGRPRPLTVLVDIPRYARLSPVRKRTALRKLVNYVVSGEASGRPGRGAPDGQQLGLTAWVRLGQAGRNEALETIELASKAGMHVVVLDGVKRKVADRALSLTGLLDYFPPGLVGPILRAATARGILVRAANLPDTETIARSTWVGLATARSFGVNLGKYGCFPLTKAEADHVVQLVQGWTRDWSAAPVFFVDQGLMWEGGVDVERDLMRGLKTWLRTVGARGVPVVLIDTIDKAEGRHLLKSSAADRAGFLSLRQIEDVDDLARSLGVKALWAGGLELRDVYEMGRLGVFGVYVTSAAATSIPARGSYVRDPMLAGVKEPTREGVLRTKILLEAGFLSTRSVNGVSLRIRHLAEAVLAAHDDGSKNAVRRRLAVLVSECQAGWHAHWKGMAHRRVVTTGRRPTIGGSKTTARSTSHRS